MHSDSDIPGIEPLEFTAGDTIKWKRDLSSHYPADSWTLKYYLRGPGAIDVTATADGLRFSVTLAASATAAYALGRYLWKAFVTKAAERFQVGEGYLTVLENQEKINRAIETRSNAKQILEKLIEAYKLRAGRPEQSYTIQAAGRSFTFKSDADWITTIQFWQGEVAREEMAEKLARGEKLGQIHVRFP